LSINCTSTSQMGHIGGAGPVWVHDRVSYYLVRTKVASTPNFGLPPSALPSGTDPTPQVVDAFPSSSTADVLSHALTGSSAQAVADHLTARAQLLVGPAIWARAVGLNAALGGDGTGDVKPVPGSASSSTMTTTSTDAGPTSDPP